MQIDLFKTEECLFQVFRKVIENGKQLKGLEVYGTKKDCEDFIKIEAPAYLHPTLTIEPYNSEVWKESDEYVICARDFQTFNAKEMVEYLKLPYDKRKLIRSFRREK